MMNVLVVEPDRAVAWLLQEELEEAGFGVLVCRDREQAALSLRHKRTDVVLGDADDEHNDPYPDLTCLAQARNCSVVLLGPRDCQPREGMPLMIRKSADLGPLIKWLHGHAAKSRWMSSC